MRIGPTMGEARTAKRMVLERLGGQPWLRGVGISRASAGGGLIVRVNVDKFTPEVRARVPKQIGSVPVELMPVGRIRPQRQPAISGNGSRPGVGPHLFICYQRVGLKRDGTEVRKAVERRIENLTEPQALAEFMRLVARFDGVGWWSGDQKGKRWRQRH